MTPGLCNSQPGLSLLQLLGIASAGQPVNNLQMINYCGAVSLENTWGFIRISSSACRNASRIGPESFTSHLNSCHPSSFICLDTLAVISSLVSCPVSHSLFPPQQPGGACEHLSQVMLILCSEPSWFLLA